MLQLCRFARTAMPTLACVGMLAACSDTPAPSKLATNVVLITLDTTRADAIGAYGQPLPITPNIDRLAAAGVLFEHTLSAAPHTLTSHASIMTARYPPAHGVRANQGYRLAASNRTLAEALRDAGYATGAEIAATVLRGDTQIAQGFESVGDTETPGAVFQRAASGEADAHAHDLVRKSDDITNAGIAFLRRHHDRKFLLWLHYFDAHSPYSPPAALARRYPNDPYLAEVAAMDVQIGRVVAALDELGLRERTLIVVTSDHGEGLGDHAEPTHSYFVYDTTMRIPLILSGPPALPAGRRIAAVTRSVDIAPTVLDSLGLAPLPASDGVSLRPWIDGSPPETGSSAYGETLDLFSLFGTTPLRMLREGRWKYIHKVSPELYDVEADPKETKNLAGERPDRVGRMANQLHTLLAGMGAAPEDATLEVDAATQAGLEALGYVAPSRGRPLPGELALLEFFGGDPAHAAKDAELIAVTNRHLTAQRYTRALQNLEGLDQRHPGRGQIARLSGEALFGLDRIDAAIAAFELALEREPDNDANLRGLHRALEAAGRVEDATAQLRAFVALQPCSIVCNQLARRHHALGQYAEQHAVLADAARQCPETPGILNDYAWFLATSQETALRDGTLAVQLAERAIAAREGSAGANELDTLAAAHAEAGDFATAAKIARQVVRSLEARDAPAGSLSDYRARVQQFEDETPVRY